MLAGARDSRATSTGSAVSSGERPDPWVHLFQPLDTALADLVANHFTDPVRYPSSPELADVRELIFFVSGVGTARRYERFMRDSSQSVLSALHRAQTEDLRYVQLHAALDERTGVATRLILAGFLSAPLAIELLVRGVLSG